MKEDRRGVINGGIVQKMCRGHGETWPRVVVSARIVGDGHDLGRRCVHAALYKNRLFVAAIYR